MIGPAASTRKTAWAASCARVHARVRRTNVVNDRAISLDEDGKRGLGHLVGLGDELRQELLVGAVSGRFRIEETVDHAGSCRRRCVPCVVDPSAVGSDYHICAEVCRFPFQNLGVFFAAHDLRVVIWPRTNSRTEPVRFEHLGWSGGE